MKRTTACFIGAVLCTTVMVGMGCSSTPSESDPTPDPAKAAKAPPKDPNATPAAPVMMDPKSLRKLKLSGGTLPPK